MEIVKLILAIFIPPVGLVLNFITGAETKLEKISVWISSILTAVLIGLVIFAIVLVGANNGAENDLLKCRNPHHCDSSDSEYQTCYYCKDDNCNKFGKIQCINDGDRFNYETVDENEGHVEE